MEDLDTVALMENLDNIEDISRLSKKGLLSIMHMTLKDDDVDQIISRIPGKIDHLNINSVHGTLDQSKFAKLAAKADTVNVQCVREDSGFVLDTVLKVDNVQDITVLYDGCKLEFERWVSLILREAYRRNILLFNHPGTTDHDLYTKVTTQEDRWVSRLKSWGVTIQWFGSYHGLNNVFENWLCFRGSSKKAYMVRFKAEWEGSLDIRLFQMLTGLTIVKSGVETWVTI